MPDLQRLARHLVQVSDELLCNHKLCDVWAKLSRKAITFQWGMTIDHDAICSTPVCRLDLGPGLLAVAIEVLGIVGSYGVAENLALFRGEALRGDLDEPLQKLLMGC